jgi:hypothetical protein
MADTLTEEEKQRAVFYCGHFLNDSIQFPEEREFKNPYTKFVIRKTGVGNRPHDGNEQMYWTDYTSYIISTEEQAEILIAFQKEICKNISAKRCNIWEKWVYYENKLIKPFVVDWTKVSSVRRYKVEGFDKPLIYVTLLSI